MSYARVDGPAKVTGEARYTVDVQLEGQLEGRILRSPVAHGILRGVSTAAAAALPGVEAVHRLVPDGGRIRFVGQELLAVAAVDAETARLALALVELNIQELPAAITVEQAVARGAPVLYDTRRERRSAPKAGEIGPSRGRWEANLHGPTSSSVLARPGKGRRGIERAQEAGFVAQGEWRTQAQCHTALEPHAAVARFTGSQLEVWASTQSCASLAQDIAQRFKLRRDGVVVRCPFVGGAFGAKTGLQMESLVAVELARASGSAVRVVLSREEELTVGGARPGQRVELSLGMGADGEFLGLRQLSTNDGGVSVGHTSGFVSRLIYPSPAKDLDDVDVVTNTPPAYPFRGPGGPAVFFALEGAIDQLAHSAGHDPVELRRRWDPSEVRHKLYNWASELDVWKHRGPVAVDQGRFRRGVGLAASAWFHLWDPGTQVELEASSDGIVVRVACQDPGTGTASVLAATVAARLGLDPTDIRVELGDSRYPHGPTSAGSRVTSSVVPAAEHAVEQLISVLVERAHNQGIEGEVGIGGLRDVEGKLVPWRRLLEGQPPVWTVGRRRRDLKAALIPVPFDHLKVGRVLPAAVHVTEVMVDMVLGRAWVREAWVGVGAGRIVTPDLARSQVEGAVVQGISYALYEQRRLDPASGHLLTHGLDDYRIAGIGDVPEIHVHFEESGFEHVRGGAVGLGEIGTVAVVASIANAMFHATGVRPQQLPLDPARLLEILA